MHMQKYSRKSSTSLYVLTIDTENPDSFSHGSTKRQLYPDAYTRPSRGKNIPVESSWSRSRIRREAKGRRSAILTHLPGTKGGNARGPCPRSRSGSPLVTPPCGALVIVTFETTDISEGINSWRRRLGDSLSSRPRLSRENAKQHVEPFSERKTPGDREREKERTKDRS